VAQGQSFVNDPSMTNSSEVKAHIKLRFNNKSGQPTVVARLFQVNNVNIIQMELNCDIVSFNIFTTLFFILKINHIILFTGHPEEDKAGV
jgi:hypothetical protein